MSFESGLMNRVRTIEAKKNINEKFIVEEQICCCAEEYFCLSFSENGTATQLLIDIAV